MQPLHIATTVLQHVPAKVLTYYFHQNSNHMTTLIPAEMLYLTPLSTLITWSQPLVPHVHLQLVL